MGVVINPACGYTGQTRQPRNSIIGWGGGISCVRLYRTDGTQLSCIAARKIYPPPPILLYCCHDTVQWITRKERHYTPSGRFSEPIFPTAGRKQTPSDASKREISPRRGLPNAVAFFVMCAPPPLPWFGENRL